MTKSASAVPGSVVGHVSTVKMEGSCHGQGWYRGWQSTWMLVGSLSSGCRTREDSHAGHKGFRAKASGWTYGVVKGRCIDDHELGQIVLVGRIVAMPRNDVKGRMVLQCQGPSLAVTHLCGFKELALELGNNGELALHILKGGGGRQKVSRIGQSVGACD